MVHLVGQQKIVCDFPSHHGVARRNLVAFAAQAAFCMI
jgi:hypothetical protein